MASTSLAMNHRKTMYLPMDKGEGFDPRITYGQELRHENDAVNSNVNLSCITSVGTRVIYILVWNWSEFEEVAAIPVDHF